MSPDRSHSSSGRGFPSPSFSASSRSPGLSGPISPAPLSPIPVSPPPMSAKSFGTFIDSEPSTPAYSPRMDHDWDNSTLVLLRPTSSSSEPSTPKEPTWDMMVPLQVPTRNLPGHKQSAVPTVTSRNARPATKQTKSDTKVIGSSAPLSSNQNKKVKPIHRPKEIKIVDIQPKENALPKKVEIEAVQAIKSPGAKSTITSPASFGKLASRMKFMLRRRSTGEKKKVKKEPMEVDRLEDVHWTEM